mmetsp:Transcript_35602/g.100011  ORF Transcript_35602/g.100011 Transcript_35602/m.100011 type:complete len:400 (-) Transcript_35602:527-1726(-)
MGRSRVVSQQGLFHVHQDGALLPPGAAAQGDQQCVLAPRFAPDVLHALAVAGVDLLGVCAPLRRHVLLRRLFHGCGVRLPSRHRSHRRRRRAPRPRGFLAPSGSAVRVLAQDHVDAAPRDHERRGLDDACGTAGGCAHGIRGHFRSVRRSGPRRGAERSYLRLRGARAGAQQFGQGPRHAGRAGLAGGVHRGDAAHLRGGGRGQGRHDHLGEVQGLSEERAGPGLLHDAGARHLGRRRAVQPAGQGREGRGQSRGLRPRVHEAARAGQELGGGHPSAREPQGEPEAHDGDPPAEGPARAGPAGRGGARRPAARRSAPGGELHALSHGAFGDVRPRLVAVRRSLPADVEAVLLVSDDAAFSGAHFRPRPGGGARAPHSASDLPQSEAQLGRTTFLTAIML